MEALTHPQAKISDIGYNADTLLPSINPDTHFADNITDWLYYVYINLGKYKK